MSTPEHGLTYPPGFLPALPVLLSRPCPHTPIRQLTAAQFATLHHRSQLSHAPDHALFPFLHGLEGDNQAQNSFFATGYTVTEDGRRGPAKVPNFRGLIWVAVEEDAEEAEDSEEDDYDDYSSDIEVDVDESEVQTFAMDMDAEPEEGEEKEHAYMHPLARRAPSPPPTATQPLFLHERSPTVSSTSSSTPPSPTFTTASYSTTGSSLPSSPVCESDAAPFSPSQCAAPLPTGLSPRLTSTFKARELLEVNERGDVKFATVRVPDGISLRNFGIQVPIYATLSDIVVYSRRGASRAAFALAEKFKHAVEAKAEERMAADANNAPVRYNVFVLNASHEDMARELPYLITRTEADAHSSHGGAHTDGTDAHAAGGMSSANTVNFAQREKDEMRDLTRASEIVTVGEGERAGQVLLGNSNDVPLPAEGDLNDAFNHTGNDPALGFGFDVCVACHDCVPIPSVAELRAAEDHLTALEAAWVARRNAGAAGDVRPPPHPSAIVHIRFPSSPSTINRVLPLLEFLRRILTPGSADKIRKDANTENVGRGARVLIWSSDGYTESSVLALCLLMFVRGLNLAEAYLELQVAKKRSFFVYQSDLGLLRRVETKLVQDRQAQASPGRSRSPSYPHSPSRYISFSRPTHAHSNTLPNSLPANFTEHSMASEPSSLPESESTPANVALDAPPIIVPSQRRPRASTSPLLPSLVADHQVWFDDPRFDGSFPSRVLPFLYLGNLNHASNAYMLHALGITHVVSVGECALVPPPDVTPAIPSSSSTFANSQYGPSCTTTSYVPGKGPGRQGSLWIEEREGRIKVLDIKGVCDDGIDTLEPQLEPICDWIEKARKEGGQVLVHCRVGVSRSATVTIAYVMKHLSLPLVDAYLIVRSRRLSVLIQPNMRLLYNLCGWEVKLARERAGGDERRLKGELARSLNWPYLAREVHALNEKYLH